MAGADGLGKEVVQALSTVNLAQGVEAGLSVVILAVFLDRVTAALGDPAGQRSSLMSLLARRRAAARESAPASAPADAPHAEPART
jgi:glycine betaine/proline transport system permease protein